MMPSTIGTIRRPLLRKSGCVRRATTTRCSQKWWANLSLEEEKVPETEETLECPNCWCETTQSELDSDDGCSECGLGTDADENGLGIGCEFCERCYSDECDWDNGNRVLQESDIPHDWLFVCPECQTDDDLMERLDEEAEKYAIEYFQRNHPKKYNPVLDQILESHGSILPSACGFPKSRIDEHFRRESEKRRIWNGSGENLFLVDY